MSEVTFEVVENIGTICERDNGWTKEINRVSWNGAEPKFDIRDWDPGHERMSRGITLFEEEARALYNHLKEYFEEDK